MALYHVGDGSHWLVAEPSVCEAAHCQRVLALAECAVPDNSVLPRSLRDGGTHIDLSRPTTYALGTRQDGMVRWKKANGLGLVVG